MKKKNVLIVGAVVSGGVLVMILLALGIFAVGYYGISSREVTEEEKVLLISVDDLAQFAEIPGDRSLCESYIAKRNLDGSLELEYAYDTDEDPDSPDFLFMKSEAETNRSVSDAKESFEMGIKAYKIGAGLVSGREVTEDPSLFSLGEDNYSAVLTQDGEIVGNFIVARKGRRVFSFLIMGLYFEEGEMLESLLESTIQ